MTKQFRNRVLTVVYISTIYPKYKRYCYKDLPKHTCVLLSSALLAAMKDGIIVDYIIFTVEVVINDEKRY